MRRRKARSHPRRFLGPGAIETDEAYRKKLQTLAVEARDHRDHEEKALCGEGAHEDLIQWARDWRK